MERNFPRNFLILLLLFGIKSTAYLVLGQTAETSGTVCLPPAFTNTAPPYKIYTTTQQTVVLPCSAVGTPTPTYTWNKNGVSLSIDNSHITQSQGSISIQSPTSNDQGMYQCVANNQWGTAVSNNTFLQMAYLNNFPTTSDAAGMSGNVSAPLQLRCIGVPTSVPNATYSWIYTPSMTLTPTTLVPTNNRISVDQATGNLFIANLLSTDATTAGSNRSYYGCSVYNSFVQTTYSGSFTTLNVITTNSVVQTPPTSAYQTSSPITALLGNTITISCFFNGYPTPTISWAPTSGSFPSSRYSITNNNTMLTITGLQSTDPPGYTCTGTNSNGQASNTISLQFGAAPAFLTSSDSPNNINATDGDTVKFVCSTSANPSTSITWYRNYFAINQGNVNSRTTFSNDLTTVTITDVCKDCSDGSSDLAVYQCNATNTYGYAFAQGYLNVLLNTSIVSGPESVSLVVGGTVTFSCSATSDPSTPVQISWEFDGSPLNPSTGKYTMSSGSLTISDAQTSDEGTYTCVATNGYSTDYASADLLTPVVVIKSAADFWYLFLIFGLLLLLLLLLLIYYCCYYNEGNDYPVDKQERKNGNDPVKEIKNTGFQDYQRPEVVPLPMGGEFPPEYEQQQQQQQLGMYYGDPNASVNFSNFFNDRYNEEGSFINQYRPNQTSAVPYANFDDGYTGITNLTGNNDGGVVNQPQDGVDYPRMTTPHNRSIQMVEDEVAGNGYAPNKLVYPGAGRNGMGGQNGDYALNDMELYPPGNQILEEENPGYHNTTNGGSGYAPESCI